MNKSILRLVIGALTILILSTVSIGQTPVIREYNADHVSVYIPAGIVWSENFDGGDISNWNFFEINWTEPIANLTADPYDLFDVSGGVLRAIGPEWNFAAINSTIAYGTWNFTLDIQKPDESNRVTVAIMAEKFNETWLQPGHTADGFRLNIFINDEGPDGDIEFRRGERDKGSALLGSFVVSNILGWHNFIITRELTGQFHIYLDEVHKLEPIDNTTITHERFAFYAMANPAIDNVTISDTIDYDKAPPTLYRGASYKTIYEGEPFRCDLNASDPSGIDTWWISDIENFTIDEDGVVTNNTVLSVGEYSVGVWVNDTLGYTRYTSFTVGVLANTPTTTTEPTTTTPSTTTSNDTTPNGEYSLPLELILALGGGAVVIIIILVILTKRKS